MKELTEIMNVQITFIGNGFVDLMPNDIVHVVRCKDCKWRNIDDDCTHEWWRDAEGWDKYVEDNDFCSHGERREEK